MAVTSLPPTSPDPQSQVPAKRAPLTSDEFAKLSALLQHVNAEGFTVPETVKEARELQKKRAKGSKDPKSWVGRSLMSNGGKPLTDREKHYLSSERERAPFFGTRLTPGCRRGLIRILPSCLLATRLLHLLLIPLPCPAIAAFC